MRDIKFEYGFESVNGIVKKVYHISEIPRISHRCDVWNVLPLCYVRQYTGLKDKNGVEIYEGDLYTCLHFDKVYVVEFKNGAFCGGVYESKSAPLGWEPEQSVYTSEYTGDLVCEETNYLKVIGNIHQNPELLKA